MKIIKKIIISLLTFLLMDLFTILIYSMTAQDVIINGVLQAGLSNNIMESVEVENINEEEIENVVEEELSIDPETLNQILQTEEIKELMNDFITTMLNELSSEGVDVNNLELDKELINYLKDHKEIISDKIGLEITDEMLNETEKELEDSHIGEIIDKSIKETKKELSPRDKKVLKTFQLLSKTSTKIYIVLGIIITVILIALIEKSIYKWISNLSYAIAVSGLIIVTSGYSILYIVRNKMNGIVIDVSPMTNLGFISLGFGITISILYFIFKKFIIKDDENEIS